MLLSFDQLRHQTWHTNTTLESKLLGSLDDLCRTTHFMTAAGLRVYRTQPSNAEEEEEEEEEEADTFPAIET